MLPLLRRQASAVPRAARAYASSGPSTASAYSKWLSKGQSALQTSLYYSKVVGELAKYVWLKEGLSPPTIAQVQQTLTTDAKAFFDLLLQQSKQPAKLLQKAQSLTKKDYILVGAGAVQLLGLFSLGEIVGRRHVYGYKQH